MSLARGFGLNGRAYYTNISKPCIVQCNFVVDSTNGNGFGVRSIKSNGYIRNVFMHTSATPGVNDGMTNPNPVVGVALVQFKQNFNYYVGGFSGFVSPAGSNQTTVTNHSPYIITILGTATLAQWQAVGVPVGFTPAVGMSFVATSTGTIGGSANVAPPSVSGVSSLEVIGDPNQSIGNSSIASNGGAIVLVQMLGATSSSVTTSIPTAPANGSVVGMTFYFDGSSVTIDGL